MKSAAELIGEARRRLAISQAALARRAGLPRSVLNAYERSKRQPSAETLAKILRAAGFKLELRPLIDLDHNARILEQVLDLAASLPWKPRRRLGFVPFHRRVA